MASPYIRHTVTDFSLAMESMLRLNDWKGGWDNDTPLTLLDKLREEFHELVDAVKSGKRKNIMNEATDLALICMMMYDLSWNKEHDDSVAYKKDEIF